MTEFLFHRIVNNKWLFACLFLGAIAACAIFSSIPMYSNAVLQKVLTKDLENYHLTQGASPASYKITCNRSSADFENIATMVENRFSQDYGLPIASRVKKIESTGEKIRRENKSPMSQGSYGSLVSLTDMDLHIKLIHGHLPAKDTAAGVYEVMATENAMKQMNLLLDGIYGVYETYAISQEEVLLFKIKVVGIFTMEDPNDLYWSEGMYEGLNKSVILDEKLLMQIINDKKEIWLNQLEWTYYFDYQKIRIQNVNHILSVYEQQNRWVERNQAMLSIKSPLENVLQNYGGREKQLRLTLWILTIPLMMIIFFYTLLIAGLIVKNDRNEIAVLKSRGAGTLQIFLLYVLQCGIVSAVSSAAGPVLAYFICRVLGSSNGFMEFVNRKALRLEITYEIIAYAVMGAVAFAVFMLIPALNACRVSIVEYKKSRMNIGGKPFWQKLYLDVLVLGLSVYGVYRYKSLQNVLGSTGKSGTEFGIDPLLYFISTFFILGIGLLFLRIYPLLVMTVFKAGKSLWNPVMYFSLVNAGRAERNSQFIMLFLMLALAFGIINANQARTINQNVDDKIMYSIGADVVIEPYNNLYHENIPDGIETATSPAVGETFYKEPPYWQYEKLDGISSITKVVVKNNLYMTSGSNKIQGVKAFGIIPGEFGKTAWFRNDLYPYHINEYLNMMTQAPRAALISSDIRDKTGIEIGDEIEIKFDEYGYLTFVVYAFIDYFPVSNNYQGTANRDQMSFAVLNYSYIQNKLPLQPFEIWIKKQPGTTDATIHGALEEKQLAVERVEYAKQEMIQKRNDPVLQGTNGILTMCFIITMMITLIGFLLFWILSMKEKTLSFGIFRAIGMTMSEISLTLILEQILISGCAIAAGIVISNMGSRIFIPMLQMAYETVQQEPPFKITALPGDYAKVVFISLIMLFTALSILFILLKKMKVNQVLKLGED